MKWIRNLIGQLIAEKFNQANDTFRKSVMNIYGYDIDTMKKDIARIQKEGMEKMDDFYLLRDSVNYLVDKQKEAEFKEKHKPKFCMGDQVCFFRGRLIAGFVDRSVIKRIPMFPEHLGVRAAGLIGLGPDLTKRFLDNTILHYVYVVKEESTKTVDKDGKPTIIDYEVEERNLDFYPKVQGHE